MSYCYGCDQCGYDWEEFITEGPAPLWDGQDDLVEEFAARCEVLPAPVDSIETLLDKLRVATWNAAINQAASITTGSYRIPVRARDHILRLKITP